MCLPTEEKPGSLGDYNGICVNTDSLSKARVLWSAEKVEAVFHENSDLGESLQDFTDYGPAETISQMLGFRCSVEACLSDLNQI